MLRGRCRCLLLLLAGLVAACSDGLLDGGPGDGAPPVRDTGGRDRGAGDLPRLDARRDGPQADARRDDLPHPTDSGGCGEFAGATRMTCSKDGNSRGSCVGGAPKIESCARGCLRKSSPDDDVCMGTTTSFACSGSYGTGKAEDGDYYLTSFGCWTDEGGTTHQDSGDNCIPACFSKAQSAGVCQSGWDGPECEQKVNWFVADSGRFGCLARLRITDPKSGKAVVGVVLDAGPACWVEQNASKAILDASSRISMHLFGTTLGWSDKALVHVVEVDASTPLGPVP